MNSITYILCKNKIFDELKIKYFTKKYNLSDSVVTVMRYNNYSFYKIFKNKKIYEKNQTKNNFSADTLNSNNLEIIEDYLKKQNIFSNENEEYLNVLRKQIGDFSFTYYDVTSESIIYGNIGSNNKIYVVDDVDNFYISNNLELTKLFSDNYRINRSNFIHKISNSKNKTKCIYEENSLDELKNFFENLKEYCLKKTYGVFLNNNYDPMVGRVDELQELEKSLLTNKITLLTGIGKTNLVNSLSYNIDNSNVPTPLKNKKILKVNLSELNTKFDVDKLTSILLNNKDIILFVDNMKCNLELIDDLTKNILDNDIKAIYSCDKRVNSKYFNIIKLNKPSIELMNYIIKYNISLNIYNLNFKISEEELNIIINLIIKISNNDIKKSLDLLNQCFANLLVSRIETITFNEFIDVLKGNNNITNLEVDILSHFVKSKKK